MKAIEKPYVPNLTRAKMTNAMARSLMTKYNADTLVPDYDPRAEYYAAKVPSLEQIVTLSGS